MFAKKLLELTILIVISIFLINCGRAKFGLEGLNSDLASNGNGSNIATGDEEVPNVICDPLNEKVQAAWRNHDDKKDDLEIDDENDDDNDGENTTEDDTQTEYVKDPLICEIPGDPEDPDEGLIGKIYYLLPEEHEDLFGGSLRNTVLDDYFTHGYVVDTDIYMTSINVTPRPWDTGFRLPDGSIVKDLNGQELFEWFAFKLDGHLRLPEGQYDFAMISDDGMKIDLNGENILLHDGIHPPTIMCADAPVSFGADEAKKIHLEYFQGPRVQISMQLLMRPHDPNGGCSRNDGSWQEIPAENYSK